jgi:hypothetical protein
LGRHLSSRALNDKKINENERFWVRSLPSKMFIANKMIFFKAPGCPDDVVYLVVITSAYRKKTVGSNLARALGFCS